ncbi:MAG TPA: FHA domain-containing protein, partial [Gammaproteobacteria bacterium]|nr:FHA domain-containing protein [Gammaproteobacteria bacterium]
QLALRICFAPGNPRSITTMFDFQSRKDKHSGGDAPRQTQADNVGDATDTIARLQRTLEQETVAAETLRADLDQLREEVERIEASFQQRLAEATARREQAESKLAEQSARLNALGRGREQTMLELQETRAELARVKSERDRLQRELIGVARMQTETLALTDAERDDRRDGTELLPTLEDLMANWSAIEEAPAEQGASFTPALETEDEPEDEMIPANAVFTPDDFRDDQAGEIEGELEVELELEGERRDDSDGGGAQDGGGGARESDSGDGLHDPPTVPAPPRRRNSSVLVFLETDPPIKYPLYKEVTTIGRSELADIRVDGDFISRVHARILTGEGAVTVEDAGSKNGIEVNGRPVLRHALQHGDVVSLGTLHFTYIDTTARGRET